MFTTSDRPESTELSTAPTGPKGLWGALAHAAAPSIGLRSLPLTDMALVGSVSSTSSMFDYDRALASDLEADFTSY